MPPPRAIMGISNAQLVQAYNEGLSGNATLKILREQGYGMRTQDFYDQWRGVAGYTKNQWRASLQPEDRAPTDEFLQPGGANMYKKYQYTFTAERWDADKKTYVSGVLSLTSDERITIAKAREQLQEGLLSNRGQESYQDRLRGFAGGWVRPD